MTRDFKQNDSSASPNQYGLSWVLGGIAVGLLAGGLVYAYMSNQINSGNSSLNVTNPAETAEGAAILPAASDAGNPTLQDEPEEDTRPGFIYHAVLPQLEVDVPIPPPEESAPADQEPIEEPVLVEEDDDALAEVAAAQETQSNLAKGRYMFQLGAYQSQAQAVQMQRRAQQNGMNTRIETANINGKTWFRVRLGPTEDLQVVNIWKQRLSGMGINPMMIRL